MEPRSLVFMNIYTQNLFNTEKGYCYLKIIEQKLNILTMNCAIVQIWHKMKKRLSTLEAACTTVRRTISFDETFLPKTSLT